MFPLVIGRLVNRLGQQELALALRPLLGRGVGNLFGLCGLDGIESSGAERVGGPVGRLLAVGTKGGGSATLLRLGLRL